MPISSEITRQGSSSLSQKGGEFQIRICDILDCANETKVGRSNKVGAELSWAAKLFVSDVDKQMFSYEVLAGSHERAAMVVMAYV